MIFTYSKLTQSSYGTVGAGGNRVYSSLASDVSLEDILACCLANNAWLVQVLDFVKKQGFRRERRTRKELFDKMNATLIEVRDMKKEIRRREIPGGYNDATDDKL